MRLISVRGRIVELNYMWLPTWLGQNAQFKRDLEKALRSEIEGLELNEDTLNRIDRMVLQYIVDHNPHVQGLYDYLDGLKFVELEDPDGG